MHWLQLRINTSQTNANAVQYALQKLKALAITLQDNADQPILEPALGETPLWQETRVTGLFDANINTQEISDLLHKKMGQRKVNLHWHVLENKDWERQWMSHYAPIHCGNNLWICPSWTPPPEPDAINLMLDPGLAFGTGTHPTTFLCLQWLSSQHISDKKIIDYGCGSGILGIASLLMGASSAIGIDIDPQALLAAQENTKRNNLKASQFPVFFPDKAPLSYQQHDIVFANILAGPLVELADTLIQLTAKNGIICLSGILSTQVDTILKAYSSCSHDKITHKDGWACIVLKQLNETNSACE